ncbi:MAG TPA: hypothetical protein DCR14_06010 [Acidimicrobiaceae bacterium]|nr:hypothetical protein [Acidimicrobiaceae bacterium]
MAFDSLRYSPVAGRFDEVRTDDGQLRPTWQAVARALGPLEPGVLIERQRQADRLLDAEGTGHLVHDLSVGRAESHPWRLDPVPFVLDAVEFEWLAACAVQRMQAIEATLADCYGAQRLVADGVLNPATLFGLPGYRPTAGGPGVIARWVSHYAIDLVRDDGGVWYVAHDAVDAPSGLGYSLLNRAVLARLLPDGLRAAGASSIHRHADVVRRALAAVAPPGRPSPRTVVFSGGPTSDTYVEHSYLATRLGVHLVEAADVVMRAGRLWLRALNGLEPIDVVYRRLGDAYLDPLEPGHHGGGIGVPGLVWGARRGGVTLANAYGAALAEAPAFAAALPDAAQHLLGEGLRLDMLPSGARLATSPVFDRTSGSLVPRPLVIRLQVAAHDGTFTVMRGGAGRVLAEGDEPLHPTAQVAKDVWVLDPPGVPRSPVLVAAPSLPPQVDFGASVPTRVADALYFLGRAAERAEVAARTLRVVSQQLEQDPALVSVADGGWAIGARALLRAAQGVPLTAVPEGVPLADAVATEVWSAAGVVGGQLATVVREAASVREYLSTTTGRVLGRIAEAQVALADGVVSPDALDTVLVDLAALAGLATESTVRGPAWRFLDLGRRLERALAVLGATEAALALDVSPLGLQPVAEATLAANESLVAYRRRYRSDVDLDAVLDLLLHDDANPRSLAYQLDRLREHVASLAWPDGATIVNDASLAALGHPSDTVAAGRRMHIDAFVIGVRGHLLGLSDAVVQRWFADPVNPTVMRGR